MRKSLLAVVTATACATTLLSGCSGGVERVGGAAAPVPAPATSTTSAGAGAAPTTPPATTATSPAGATSAPPTSRPPARPAKACPVTNAGLQKALRTNPDDGVFPGSTFTKIVCFQDYAATTVPERSNSDESYVVWKHTAGTWRVLSSGTADICPGVPADVVRHFRAARYGACGRA